MKTVKEVSKLTGISVRTLHYYDEIGLLKPTTVTEAGYRLYDDKALELLQQILFFREFDTPLREIKSVLYNPALEREQLLKSQKQMLVLKKERLERIIASIDNILKGDNAMDFGVFDKTDMEKMVDHIIKSLTDEQQEIFVKEYGSLDNFREHFLNNASSEEVQKNLAKVVEWYGDKESAMAASTNPDNPQIIEVYGKRLEEVTRKLAAKAGSDVNSLEVKMIMGEMDFVSKQLYQMEDATAFMLYMAKQYLSNETMQKNLDAVYGEGSTVFIGQALKAFYEK